MFIKNTPAGIQQLHPAHHSKSTIHSNHSNMFELPTAGSLQGSKVSPPNACRSVHLSQQWCVITSIVHCYRETTSWSLLLPLCYLTDSQSYGRPDSMYHTIRTVRTIRTIHIKSARLNINLLVATRGHLLNDCRL
mgnify:CR=1 FL=1